MRSHTPDKLARYLMEMTPLGRVLSLPAVIDAFAQDKAAETLLPFARTPNFIENAPSLRDEWARARPESSSIAAPHLESLRRIFEKSEFIGERLMLRMEALRKIDATLTGTEVFTKHPALAGLPYYVERDPGTKLAVKVGAVQQANYGDLSPASLSVLASVPAVEFVERALLPFVASGETAAAVTAWDACWKIWRDTKPMREFEQSSKLMLFPHLAVSPILFIAGSPPDGYLERISAADLKSTGVTYESLLRIGISPYIAVPVHEFLRANPQRLAKFRDGNAAIQCLARRIAANRLGADTAKAGAIDAGQKPDLPVQSALNLAVSG